MKLNKTNITFLLTILTLLLFFISCSDKQEEDKNKIQINIWMDSNDKEMEYLKKVSKSYEKKNSNVKINYKFITFNDLKPQFIGNSKTNNEPDIIFVVNDWLGEFVEKGLIKEIKNDNKDIIPITLESFVYDNKLYGIPRNFEVLALIYNKKLVSKPPETINEVINVSKDLVSKNKYGLLYDTSDFYYHIPWLYGFGGKIFDEKGRFLKDELKNKESFEYVLDLKNKHKIIPENANQYAMINLFCSEEAGMIITGPWFVDEIEKNNIEYGITNLPKLENGNYLKPFLGVKGYSITSYSKNPVIAKDIIEFFTNYENQLLAMNEIGILPINKTIYEKENIPERINGFYEQSKHSVPMPAYPEMKFIWQEYNWALSQIFTNNKPINEVLDKATNDIEKQIINKRL